jgi:uncharacterized protein (DUF2147 family)
MIMQAFSVSVVLCCLIPLAGIAQVTGKWKHIDDKDGKEKSIIEIFEKDGMLYGRVDQLLKDAPHRICEKCPGELKNKPIEGMVILREMRKTNNGGDHGKILDPGTGKTYSVQVELASPDKLKLRGYIGSPAFGRTQYWSRVSGS